MNKTFDEVYRNLPSGWLEEDEARLLWNEVGRIEGPILEVGCYKGRSTCLLAALGRPLYCVDPFEGFDSDDPTGNRTKDEWLSRMSNLDSGLMLLDLNVPPEEDWTLRIKGESTSITLFRSRIEDWTPRPVGFAYLDGDHTYQGTVNQIRKALWCSPEVIAVHDVNDSGGGKDVKYACSVMLGPWTERVNRLAIWRTWRGK